MLSHPGPGAYETAVAAETLGTSGAFLSFGPCYTLRTHMRTHAHCTHTHTHTHTHTQGHTHKDTHTCTHASTHARARARTHTHTHTHTGKEQQRPTEPKIAHDSDLPGKFFSFFFSFLNHARTHAYTLKHTHTHALSLSHTHTHTHTHTHPHSLTFSHTGPGQYPRVDDWITCLEREKERTP